MLLLQLCLLFINYELSRKLVAILFSSCGSINLGKKLESDVWLFLGFLSLAAAFWHLLHQVLLSHGFKVHNET